jgi:hypothetical protein
VAGPDRWRFFRANLPDLIIVVVPMLRPLRILRSVRLLRLLRLARLAAFAVEGVHEARGILRRRGLSWMLLRSDTATGSPCPRPAVASRWC